jgi:hypothetical protein
MDFVHPDVEGLRKLYAESYAGRHDPHEFADKAVETIEFGSMVAEMAAYAVAEENHAEEVLARERTRLKEPTNSKEYNAAYERMSGARTALQKALGAMLPPEIDKTRRHNDSWALRYRLCQK